MMARVRKCWTNYTHIAGFLIMIMIAAGNSEVQGGETDTQSFDIVVVGGSLGASAAAFSAARVNPEAKVLLTEPTDWLGGQATAQGVAAMDNAWHDPAAKLMRENIGIYYAKDYLDFLKRIETAPDAAPGEGWGGQPSSWVSRDVFDPRTGEWALEQMSGEFKNLTVWKMTVVKNVMTEPVNDENGEGLHISEIDMIKRAAVKSYKPFDLPLSSEILDWYSPDDSKFYTKQKVKVKARDQKKGLVVIDASELADVVVLSDAVYTVGRELKTEKIGEGGQLPEMDELASLGFVFPFCVKGVEKPVEESDIKKGYKNFDAYYKEQSEKFYSLGKHSWQRVWSYRRLKNAGKPWQMDDVNVGDVSMQNWNPGNDFLQENFYKDKTGAAAERDDWMGAVKPDVLARAERHAIGWYFWYKEHKPEEVKANVQLCRGDDPLNMMNTKSGLARFPYIRGTRRIVGLDNFRITERYFDAVTGKEYQGTSYRFFDSVGIGNYAADTRGIIGSTGISPSIGKPAPFYIPYRALGSVNVRNLLTGGKLYAQTYITNSAYRLHPIEWAAGSASGTAAALMARDGVNNYALIEPKALKELQTTVAQNSPIAWAAYDKEILPGRLGDFIVNDRRPLNPGEIVDVELYAPSATNAIIAIDEKPAGESANKIDDTFRFKITIPANKKSIKADLFGADGKKIDSISVNINYR